VHLWTLIRLVMTADLALAFLLVNSPWPGG
jgi:hypothetical protein